MTPRDEPVFLTAAWRHLVMLNFAVDPAILEPHRPAGTELDEWKGSTFVSLVGFMFLDTRVRGLAIPFHRNFEEINLRFYVRAPGPDGPRRGVVFVKEVVPRAAIALVARWLYGENYVACRTANTRRRHDDGTTEVVYGWKHQGAWLRLGARCGGDGAIPPDDAEETFITEHYWGYSAQKDGGTVEYRVEHPRWRVWPALDVTLEGDVASFYGESFGRFLTRTPTSAFVADGSQVSVRKGRRLSTA